MTINDGNVLMIYILSFLLIGYVSWSFFLGQKKDKEIEKLQKQNTNKILFTFAEYVVRYANSTIGTRDFTIIYSEERAGWDKICTVFYKNQPIEIYKGGVVEHYWYNDNSSCTSDIKLLANELLWKVNVILAKEGARLDNISKEPI